MWNLSANGRKWGLNVKYKRRLFKTKKNVDNKDKTTYYKLYTNKNYVKEGVFDMKIVVLDGYTENPGDLSWEGLQELGELTVYDRTPVGDTAEIIRRIGDAQAVFTNKTPLTKEVFEACGHIRYVGVLATGYNVVDCESASAKGIPVCNIPTYGTAAVAQYTIALLLEICHHIGHHSQAVHEGRWQSCPDWCFGIIPLSSWRERL